MDASAQFPEYRLMNVAALVPYARNAKLHDEQQVREIAASIQEFRFISPVIITSDGGILAGHGRVLAAKLLGMEQLPCILADHLTEAQKRQFILADNKLAEKSKWDQDILRIELSELAQMPDVNLDLTGFSQMEFSHLMVTAPPVESEDFFDEGPATPAPRAPKEATKTTEGYAEFSLVMQVENREQLFDVLRRIQTDHGAETKEEQLMVLVAKYGS